jgi:hypothetical protein
VGHNQEERRNKLGHMRDKVQDAIGDDKVFDFFLMLQRLVHMLLIVEQLLLVAIILIGKSDQQNVNSHALKQK